MSGVVRDWRFELVEAYPDIFRPVGDPPAAQRWPSVGDGWRELLERACVRIRAAVQANGGTFHATQIKEKFGTLRFCWDGALPPEADAKIDEAIDLAEARSACTCEVCGKEGRLYRSGSWLTTRCEAHAQGRPVEIKAGLKNVHVIERIVGKRRNVRYRRYDRENDVFIDVAPASLGIEEE